MSFRVCFCDDWGESLSLWLRVSIWLSGVSGVGPELGVPQRTVSDRRSGVEGPVTSPRYHNLYVTLTGGKVRWRTGLPSWDDQECTSGPLRPKELGLNLVIGVWTIRVGPVHTDLPLVDKTSAGGSTRGDEGQGSPWLNTVCRPFPDSNSGLVAIVVVEVRSRHFL